MHLIKAESRLEDCTLDIIQGRSQSPYDLNAAASTPEILARRSYSRMILRN